LSHCKIGHDTLNTEKTKSALKAIAFTQPLNNTKQGDFVDTKLIILYCMTLLYKESMVPHQERSTALCRAVNDATMVPDNSFSMQTPREVLMGLKLTLDWMLSHEGRQYNRSQLLQRIRVVTRDESYLYNAFIEGIDVEEETEEAARVQILHYRELLRDYVNRHKVRGIISTAYGKLSSGSQSLSDYRELVRSVYQQIEPYLLNTSLSDHHAIVDQIDLSQTDQLEALIMRSKEELLHGGVLKTGYQGINRMLGASKGFRRGEMAVIGALQHHYKTGFTLNLFKQFALYNCPYMRDASKKPMLLHVSLENELPMNMMLLYKSLYENETGEVVNLEDIDPVAAAPYIYEKLSATGYHIELLRLEPNQCTINDLFELFLKYEAKGFEIHAIVCDYLNMVSKRDLGVGGPAGEDIRELFRRVRNFCAPRGITFITPHQLSTEAKMLMRTNLQSFVQTIANKGYYDGSKRIDQEVDLELYIHIEKVADRSYLTVQRGKHRTIDDAPSKDRFCVLPFRPAGGVIDDINGEDQTCSSVGGRTVEQGGGDWVDNPEYNAR
jgi:hypothetical protein